MDRGLDPSGSEELPNIRSHSATFDARAFRPAGPDANGWSRYHQARMKRQTKPSWRAVFAPVSDNDIRASLERGSSSVPNDVHGDVGGDGQADADADAALQARLDALVREVPSVSRRPMGPAVPPGHRFRSIVRDKLIAPYRKRVIRHMAASVIQNEFLRRGVDSIDRKMGAAAVPLPPSPAHFSPPYLFRNVKRGKAAAASGRPHKRFRASFGGLIHRRRSVPDSSPLPMPSSYGRRHSVDEVISAYRKRKR